MQMIFPKVNTKLTANYIVFSFSICYWLSCPKSDKNPINRWSYFNFHLVHFNSHQHYFTELKVSEV